MIRIEPRRCEDVDDLMGALIEERARNPLLGSDGLSVDSGTDGDPFTIDGIRGLCFTSRELESYVQQAEEWRTELAEQHVSKPRHLCAAEGCGLDRTRDTPLCAPHWRSIPEDLRRDFVRLSRRVVRAAPL